MKSLGKSDKECRKLVDDTNEDIKKTVEDEQKIIDELPRGEQCSTYMESTKTVKVEKEKAEKTLILRISEEKTANNARVTFGTYTFNSLTEGDCNTFYSSTAYTTAKTKHDETVKRKREAEGATKVATETLRVAIETATRQETECLCKTRADHAAAWKAALAATVGNMKAWAKSHQLSCVLDDKTSCRIPPVPQVKAPKLTSAVMEADCSAPAPAPAPAPPAPALPPADPCKKWKEEKKADEQVAKDLQSEVTFDNMSTVLKSDGKKTLDTVAKTLTKYPWMKISVQGHSSAPPGKTCDELTVGRAAVAMKYLRSKGATNKMSEPKGVCGDVKKIAIASAGGQKPPPAGCK